MTGGWKVIRTLSEGLSKLFPTQGFCAEASGAITLILTAVLGIPVSTTHTITGSIIGTGLTRGVRSVKWITAKNIVWAWILTIPAVIVVSGVIYLIMVHKYTYIIKCEEVIKDADGNIVELKCSYDPSTRPGGGEWRSVKGTIHWVSIPHAKELEIRNYDRLFTLADMSQVPEDKDYKDFLNPESLTLATGWAEPALLEDASGIAVQFERTGYYVKDADSTPAKPVFNRTATLKDSYKPE